VTSDLEAQVTARDVFELATSDQVDQASEVGEGQELRGRAACAAVALLARGLGAGVLGHLCDARAKTAAAGSSSSSLEARDLTLPWTIVGATRSKQQSAARVPDFVTRMTPFHVRPTEVTRALLRRARSLLVHRIEATHKTTRE
jgi:hypothetical protein